MSEAVTLADWFSRCTLQGQVAAIVCWYWDDSDSEDDSEEAILRDAIHTVQLVPQLVRGDTEQFSLNDWWLFFDALGSVTRTPVLEELFQIASDGFTERLPPGPTKVFWFAPEDDDETRNGKPQ